MINKFKVIEKTIKQFQPQLAFEREVKETILEACSDKKTPIVYRANKILNAVALLNTSDLKDAIFETASSIKQENKKQWKQ